MLSTLLSLSILVPSPQSTPESRILQLLSQMTLEEKVSLVHGGTDFSTKAIPRLGIPEYRFTDGPNGVRDQEAWPTTGFPTGISMASTWDINLVAQLGGAIGREAKVAGKSVQLGPGVNIDRTPVCGRTFEYYSEDPFLAGRIGVAWIKGLQAEGVSACVKHFAANSCEDSRGTVDAQVSERALREIYLPAFYAAVTEGKSGSVMAAYNKVNGQYSAENKHLMKDILKGEWGYQGFVMSDWGAVHSTIPTALNGMDLEMPGNSKNYLGDPLLAAVKAGEVPISEIDDKVKRLLRILLPIHVPNPKTDPHPSTKAHQELARKVAESAMVLLRNNAGILPLDATKLKTVAVIGPNADQKYSDTGGSGMVISPYEITPLAGIKDFLGDETHVVYARGADARQTRGSIVPSASLQTAEGGPGLDAEYFSNKAFRGEPTLKRIDPIIDFNWNKVSPGVGLKTEYYSGRWTGFLIAPDSGTYEFSTNSDDGSRVFLDGNLVVNNWGDHGMQQKSGKITLEKSRRYVIRIEFYQGYGDSGMQFSWQKLGDPKVNPWIEEAVKTAKSADAVILCVGINHDYDSEGTDKPNLRLFDGQDELVEQVLAVNPNTVVVLINGTPLELPWVEKVPTILEAWYPGLEGGHALANILFGKVNPSGKLPLTFPKKLEDSPAHANGNYPPVDDVLKYDEGILVGYRYYDTKKVEPMFPFGYGLSYTAFEYGPMTTRVKGSSVSVQFTLKNTGRMAGSEVPQLYVSEPGASELRPEKELKAFSKVWLKPGESMKIGLNLNKSSFSYWSEKKAGWTIDGGRYLLKLGSSSRDIRQEKTVEVPRQP